MINKQDEFLIRTRLCMSFLRGMRCTIPVLQAHRVANISPNETASYLLIQGVGRYDFNLVEDA